MAADGFSADATNKAIEMLTQAEVNATPAPAATEAAPPQVEAQAPPQETTPVSTPAKYELQLDQDGALVIPDDAKIRVKVDGKEKIVSPSEYKDGWSRTDVFTQRQQALAKQRQEIEQYAATREAQILEAARVVQMAREEMARNQPNLLQQLQQFQAQQQQKPFDPKEIATLGEVQQAFKEYQQRQAQEQQSQLTKLQQEWQAQLNQAQEKAQVDRDRATFSAHVASLMATEDGKIFDEIAPNAEASIRYAVLQMQPETLEQAKEFAQRVFDERISKMKERFTHQTAQQKVAEAKVVMEPAKGSPPALQTQPVKTALKKDGSIDWDSLRKRAESMLA